MHATRARSTAISPLVAHRRCRSPRPARTSAMSDAAAPSDATVAPPPAPAAETKAATVMKVTVSGSDPEATSRAAAAASSATRVCACPGCDKAAKMACPTCLKLMKAQVSNPGASETVKGFHVGFYCDQVCFKADWVAHKKQHKPWQKAITDADEVAQRAVPTGEAAKVLPEAFANYEFSGPLRPCQQGPTRYRALPPPSHIERPDWYADGTPRAEERDKRAQGSIPVYDKKAIAGIRKACAIGREVLDLAGQAVKTGVTCDELDRIVHEATIARDAYPSPLNYYHFPRSVCTSVNEVICHGIPDLYELQEGDIVNLDVSVFYKGYHGDLNETYFVGKCADDSIRLVKTAFKCLQEAAAMIKPGTLYRDLGPKICKVAAATKCTVNRTYCGHGIGRHFHCAPNVPHYAKNKAKGVMKPGHIFTIEPMVNLGHWQDRTWPDNWTAVTCDGKRSAQFEHTFLVTEDGYEILTGRPDEPVMRWRDEIQQK